jgi:carbonic anhydrase
MVMIEEIPQTKLPKELKEMYESYKKNAPKSEMESDTIVLICSDARIPVRAVSDGSMCVLENAGNVFDIEIAQSIPEHIKNIFVIGHKSHPKKGCGACAASDGLASLTAQEHAKKRKEMPAELYKVATTAKGNPEDNVKHVAESFKSFDRRFNVGYAVIDNAMCELSDFVYIDPVIEKVKSKIEKVNAHYRKNIHPEVLKKVGAEFLKRAQNPQFISVSTLDIPLPLRLGDRYLQANTFFEVKQALWMPKITGISHGSAQYAWVHYNGHDENFKTTDLTVFSSDSKDGLVEMLKIIGNHPVFLEYIGRGGRAYGISVNNEGMKFYNLIRK